MIRNKMVQYDMIIIGMGISGCYLSYKLNQLHPEWKILCLEKHCSYGGRLVSVNDGGTVIDLGAFRYSPTSHREVQKLVDQFQIPVEILNTTQTNPCSSKKINDIIATAPIGSPTNIGFVQYVYEQGADCKDLDKYITCSGYNMFGNDISLQWVKQESYIVGPYNRFPTGYRTICTKLMEQVSSNVIQRYNAKVQKIHDGKIYLHDQCIPYMSNRLIVTVQPQVLPRLIGNDEIISSMVPYIALRLYIQLDYKEILDQGLYITCLPIRKLYILPNNMALVYCDGNNATIVTSLIKNKPSLIIKWIRKLIGKHVHALSFKYKYWHDGINFWKPVRCRPTVEADYYYVNGDVSPEPGWVNGSLLMSNDTLQHF